MTWPTVDVGTANTDQGTDNPATARSDLLDLIQKFNQLHAHPSADGISLIAATDFAAMRTLLGLVIGTNVQAQDAQLQALANLTPAADRLPYFTAATVAALTVLTAFARTLLDDPDAATARATLGAQAADAELSALAGLVSAADRVPYFTGPGTAALAVLTAFARSILDDADAATARATLGANDASNLTTGTIQSPVIVPLARMKRTELSGENASTVNVNSGNVVVTLNLGTVSLGDIVWFNALATITKSPTAGNAALNVTKNTGTASIKAGNGVGGNSINMQEKELNVAASELWPVHVSGYFVVTTGGTLTMQMDASALGGSPGATISAESGQFRATVLRND